MRSLSVRSSLIVLVCLLGLTLTTGCASLRAEREVVLHPVEREDIFKIPAGTQIGMEKTDRDGWFLSEFTMSEIVKAKIEE